MRAYFPARFPAADRELAAVVHNEPLRRILLALLSLGELAHRDLCASAQMGPSTASYHLGRLLRKRLVLSRRDGRRTLFVLADRARVERALMRHGQARGDAALDAYITVWSQWRRPDRGEDAAPQDEGEGPPAP